MIGSGTASAGEVVAIAFKGRASNLFVGHPTAGESTASASHVLSDGAVLALTTSVMADRRGVVYRRAVEPDVAVAADPASDATLDQAVAWLAGARRGVQGAG